MYSFIIICLILFLIYSINYFYKSPEAIVNLKNKIMWNCLYYYTLLSEYYKKNLKSKKQYVNCFYNLKNNSYSKSNDFYKIDANTIISIIDEISDDEYFISKNLFNSYDNNIENLMKKINKNEKIIGSSLSLSYKDKIILDDFDCLDILKRFFKINISLYNLVLFIIYIKNMKNIKEFDNIKLEILNNDLEINEFVYRSDKENSNTILNFHNNEKII